MKMTTSIRSSILLALLQHSTQVRSQQQGQASLLSALAKFDEHRFLLEAGQQFNVQNSIFEESLIEDLLIHEDGKHDPRILQAIPCNVPYSYLTSEELATVLTDSFMGQNASGVMDAISIVENYLPLMEHDVMLMKVSFVLN